ncbi:MAG TPA: RCC1 domain-containing protein [Chloroflexota bacterium]
MAGSTTGSVLDWGDNTYGELGNGTTTSTYNPVTVSNLTGVTAIATSGYSSLARKADGTVWA